LSFSQNKLMGYCLIAGLVILGAFTQAEAADRPASDPAVGIAADSVFVQMNNAWQAGDEKAMAALVHRDGLRVTHGGDYDRFTTYSPDQAFYYFQDLFQGHKTVEYSFNRLPDPPDGERGLGMVEWEYLLPGRKFSNDLKFVIVLFKEENQWRLAEFNSISQR